MHLALSGFRAVFFANTDLTYIQDMKSSIEEGMFFIGGLKLFTLQLFGVTIKELVRICAHDGGLQASHQRKSFEQMNSLRNLVSDQIMAHTEEVLTSNMLFCAKNSSVELYFCENVGTK